MLCNYNVTPSLCPDNASWWFSNESVLGKCICDDFTGCRLEFELRISLPIEWSSRKSPGSDKRYIHLFTLNCIRRLIDWKVLLSQILKGANGQTDSNYSIVKNAFLSFHLQSALKAIGGIGGVGCFSSNISPMTYQET